MIVVDFIIFYIVYDVFYGKAPTLNDVLRKPFFLLGLTIFSVIVELLVERYMLR